MTKYSSRQTEDNFVFQFDLGIENLSGYKEGRITEEKRKTMEEKVKGLINFKKTGKVFFTYFLKEFVINDKSYYDLFRIKVIEYVQQFDGFGIGDINKIKKRTLQKKASTNINNGPNAEPGVRGLAYAYICWPFKHKEDLAKIETYRKSNKSTESSCGVLVRSLWQLLGARHTDYINPPYYPNQVMNYLRDYAVYCGAFSGSFPGSNIKPKRWSDVSEKMEPCILKDEDKILTEENFHPKKGDVLFIQLKDGSHAHVFTIVNLFEDRIVSCDGGQIGFTETQRGEKVQVNDGGCNGIRRRSRQFIKKEEKDRELGSIFVLKDGVGDRYITGWVDISKLEFPGELVIPHRNRGKDTGRVDDEGNKKYEQYYLPYPKED